MTGLPDWTYCRSDLSSDNTKYDILMEHTDTGHHTASKRLRYFRLLYWEFKYAVHGGAPAVTRISRANYIRRRKEIRNPGIFLKKDSLFTIEIL